MIGCKVRVMTLSVLIIAFSLSFTGCFYPKEEKQLSTLDVSADVLAVQDAFDSYTQDNGRQPLEKKDNNYQFAYPTIDLRELNPRYLDEYPKNSFIAGGTAIYLAVPLTGKTVVRLVDLHFYDKWQEMQRKVSDYVDKAGRAPLGAEVIRGVHLLDVEQLSAAEPTILSMFSTRQLNYLVTPEGDLTVDYLPDIADYLSLNPADKKAETDLTEVLIRHSFYAPIASNAYFLKNSLIEMSER